MTADLHALLSAAGIPAPYVMMGQSIGGIVARRLYAAHPGLVAGMLLVDSSHEKQVRRFDEQGWRCGPYRSPGRRHGARPGYLACAASPSRSAWHGI